MRRRRWDEDILAYIGIDVGAYKGQMDSPRCVYPNVLLLCGLDTPLEDREEMHCHLFEIASQSEGMSYGN